MSLTLTIDGSGIHDITSLYVELDRVFMPGEDWRLGESLDALDDLLYGGFGVLEGAAPVEVVWRDHAVARDALGVGTTRAWHEAKLARPEVYSQTTARAALGALDAGTGPTYWDLVLRVFADHENITLTLR